MFSEFLLFEYFYPQYIWRPQIPPYMNCMRRLTTKIGNLCWPPFGITRQHNFHKKCIVTSKKFSCVSDR